jgi:dihydrofolate synthase/folylpolyglutamate synthase
MNFSESTKYLTSLGNEVLTMKLGLENITTLLEALGNPHEKYLKVQVAGTNGKGSVCAFLDSICREAGIKTGLFTSPHLISITERIKIGGVDVSEEVFADLATRVRNTSEKLVAEGKLETVPTFFEQVTAMALLAFADAEVELAILETGLGGRYDATTAAKAEIAAITRIDLDHQEHLGDTLELIAAEKAAIIREDSAVVLTRQDKSVERVLYGRCRELGVEPIWATSDIDLKVIDVEGYKILNFSLTTDKMTYSRIEPNMAGRHQVGNASVAVGIAEILQERGLKITENDIWMGLSTATHPGRLEYDGRYLFDGAHNIGGATALREYLDEFVYEPITMIFAAMKDKEVRKIGEILFPKVDNLILTKPDNFRALDPPEIFSQTPVGFAKSVVLTSSVKDAFAMARMVSRGEGRILVTGSLYLVGEAKRILRSQI